MLELLGSAFAGGATGLVGSLFSDVAGYFNTKQQNKHDEKMAAHELAVMDKEGELLAREAESERDRIQLVTDGEIAKAEESSFQTALKDDSKILQAASRSTSKLLLITAFIRTMVRPLLTLYLSVLTTLIYYKSHVIIEKSGEIFWGSAQAFQLHSDIVNTIIYLTATAVLFWFGQRKKSDKSK